MLLWNFDNIFSEHWSQDGGHQEVYHREDLTVRWRETGTGWTFTLFCLGRSSARTQTPWPPGPAGRSSRRWCKCRRRGVWTGSCRNTRKAAGAAQPLWNSSCETTQSLVFPFRSALTRSSWSSWATGQSLAPSSSPGICCSRWKRFPPSVSSWWAARRVQSTPSFHWVAWKWGDHAAYMTRAFVTPAAFRFVTFKRQMQNWQKWFDSLALEFLEDQKRVDKYQITGDEFNNDFKLTNQAWQPHTHLHSNILHTIYRENTLFF